MGRFTEKIVMGLLALFLLITVGYQAYLGIYGNMKTETVFEYTVSRSIPVDGIAIRTEKVIDGDFQGIENYIFEDGERVTVGENVAEFYESYRSDQNLRRSREIRAEIMMLKDAQDATVNNFSGTEILNRDIKEQLGYLTDISGHKRFERSPEIRENLTALINKKQISTGMAKNFATRLNELQTELDNLDIDETDNSVVCAKAPVSGYFAKEVDGYEEDLSPESVRNYGITDYLALLDSGAPPPPQRVGKIIQNQNWIFAATAQKSSLEFVRPNQAVYITYDVSGAKIPALVTDVMQDKDEERAVILLACNQVSGSLLDMRRSGAVINFNQYTGLRLNMSDIRFQGEKRGVYVVDGNTVKFKLIDPIYEEQTFVLSRLIPPGTEEHEFVNLFDQIITKGNDLYDGKVIL